MRTGTGTWTRTGGTETRGAAETGTEMKKVTQTGRERTRERRREGTEGKGGRRARVSAT